MRKVSSTDAIGGINPQEEPGSGEEMDPVPPFVQPYFRRPASACCGFPLKFERVGATDEGSGLHRKLFVDERELASDIRSDVTSNDVSVKSMTP